MALMEITSPQATLEDIDLSSARFWSRPREERDAAFATLRREAPVRFFAESSELSGLPPGPGYWAVTRYDDIVHVCRHPQLFSSAKGVRIFDNPPELNPYRTYIIAMDDPRHGRLRGLIQRGFTPKMIRQTQQWVREEAQAVVGELLETHPDGTCDFVQEIAAPFPLRVICRMMGVPAEDEPQVVRWSNGLVGAADPDCRDGADTMDAMLRGLSQLFEYAQDLGRDRLRRPRNDITSELMHAEVDGHRLSTEEFGSFVILLLVAGNETTRNAVSHGMKALTDHPVQRRMWWDDFASVTPTAVEEILRWATPVRALRRTATTDTEIGGVQIHEGEKVVLWFESGNRDESRFRDPCTFDVRRSPNAHVAFNGGGPHFCLGASLARQEIAVMFGEIRRRLPDLEVTGPPSMLTSDAFNTIRRMPCAWG